MNYYNYSVNLYGRDGRVVCIILNNKKDFKIFKKVYPALHIIDRTRKDEFYYKRFETKEDFYNKQIELIQKYINERGCIIK